MGEYFDGRIYAVFYGEGGSEYLARRDGVEWKIVSVKEPTGVETALAEPVTAPNPEEVVRDILLAGMDRGEDIVI